MAKELEVIAEKSDEAMQKWMMGEAVIEEPLIYDENGKAITVPGCPICRVSEHYTWLSKSLLLIFHCW
ncbi:MAG: hypothetical protein JKY01_00770 [Pseudomonadales bacterium]|nr:hypothetical protein [Pseudomonadales bacterium]